MSAASQSSNQPSPWVCQFVADLKVPSQVLDLACGGGRHGRLLLSMGHHVTMLDRDVVALQDIPPNPRLEVIEANLEDGSPWPLAGRLFDAVVVTNYLHRPLFDNLVAALAPGGLLIYETFALGNEKFGRPRNPAYLLAEGELRERLQAQLQIVDYQQVELMLPRPAVVQRIAARRPQ